MNFSFGAKTVVYKIVSQNIDDLKFASQQHVELYSWRHFKMCVKNLNTEPVVLILDSNE